MLQCLQQFEGQHTSAVEMLVDINKSVRSTDPPDPITVLPSTTTDAETHTSGKGSTAEMGVQYEGRHEGHTAGTQTRGQGHDLGVQVEYHTETKETVTEGELKDIHDQV